MSDLGFDWRTNRQGEVAITHHGTRATRLRGDKAIEFLSEIDDLTPDDQQQLMARLTGNYKRGNEKLARSHPRNAR
ncbi:hypothetical protein [Flavimaricola marinus]|uniref:Uncharacterized protein n=1 Tax=Flavimaricola marinus TaxID=1819565 RepID=A0A238LD17_9RHOB|nr:hypothetical protein [Flavimaricola marinus]SMY06836.1 hypothetical protein LOM8899_00966 [Flavimaricola marinus]